MKCVFAEMGFFGGVFNCDRLLVDCNSSDICLESHGLEGPNTAKPWLRPEDLNLIVEQFFFKSNQTSPEADDKNGKVAQSAQTKPRDIKWYLSTGRLIFL